MSAPILALVAIFAQVQDPAPAKAEPEVAFSGGMDLHFFYRDGDIERSRLFLGSAVAADRLNDDGFFAGRLSLRADARFDPSTRGVLEVATLPFHGGENLPFGSGPQAVRVEQAWLALSELPVAKASLRFGIQDAKITLRPHAEPFFLDAGGAEPFYSGLDATGAKPFIAMTADRSRGQVAGLRIEADPAEFITVHLFSGIAKEAYSSAQDETLTYLYGNLWIPEQLSAFVLAATVAGPGSGTEVWTLGLGADFYPQRELELFGEGYLQRGRLGSGVGKDAWGGQFGARLWSGLAFVEVALTHRSGDGTPSDGRDHAFQSYENVNQFMIVEGAEFGLDLDTNLRSARFCAGLQGIDLGGRFRDLTLRFDAGTFQLDQGLRGGAYNGQDRVGAEFDLGVAWGCTPALTLDLKGALLVGSDVLSALAENNGAGLDRSGVTSASGLMAGLSARF